MEEQERREDGAVQLHARFLREFSLCGGQDARIRRFDFPPEPIHLPFRATGFLRAKEHAPRGVIEEVTESGDGHGTIVRESSFMGDLEV